MPGRTLTVRPKTTADPVAPETPDAPDGAASAMAPSVPDKPKAAPDRPKAAPPPASRVGGKPQSLQDGFLNMLRREKLPVTMFLVKGVKLQGIVTWFDNFSILLRRDGQSQLVYKHAVSTIMPGQPVDAAQFAAGNDSGRKQRLLQDVFLASVRDEGAQVTMFLVNGVMLQGHIAAYDLFCMLLEREGFVQLAYKHAVSTIQPAHPLDLSGGGEDDDAAGEGAAAGGDDR